MGPPAKKRKLNGSTTSSPATNRSLDFFFGKQNSINEVDTPSLKFKKPSNGLSDEELARRLQAEWNQEEANVAATDAPTSELQKDDARQANGRDNGIEQHTNSAIADHVMDGNVASKSQPVVVTAKDTLSLQSATAEEDVITNNIPFDESPLTFEPSKYVEDLQKPWAAEGGDATYALLTRCFILINSTQSRIKIVDTLVNLLRLIIEVDPSSLLSTVR